MGDLYGRSIRLTDPRFGLLTDDDEILRQRGRLALGTGQGALDSFPEYGFDLREHLLTATDPTALALLPLEVRSGLEQEPSFQTVEVVSTPTTQAGTGVSVALDVQITGASGDSVGFTVPAT